MDPRWGETLRRDSAAVLSVWVRLGSSEARLRFVLSITLQEVFQTADFSSQNKTLPLLRGGSKERANARWNKGLWVIPRISGVFSRGTQMRGKRVFSPRSRLIETNWRVDPPETESLTSVWVVSRTLRNRTETFSRGVEHLGIILMSSPQPVDDLQSSPAVVRLQGFILFCSTLNHKTTEF